jgi:hypothetical protein
MNHGLINKFFYSKAIKNEEELYQIHPELNALRRYFAEVKRRDRYYVAMKYHAIKLAKRIYPKIVLEQLAEIINAADHTTVLYYMNNYTPLEGHKEFISKHFEKFVNEKIYPITTNSKERLEHGLFKQVTLEKYREEYEIESSKKKTRKKKYVYAVKRNKEERY